MFNFWNLVNILGNKFINSDKDTFNFKGTTPIYKQDICKYDTRFSIPSMVSKVHFPNEWGIPCKSLEWASKILKLCVEFQLQLSEAPLGGGGVLISRIPVILWPNISYPINSGHKYPGN